MPLLRKEGMAYLNGMSIPGNALSMENETIGSEDMNKCGTCNTWMRGLIVSRDGRRYANYCKKCVDGDDNELSADSKTTRRDAR